MEFLQFLVLVLVVLFVIMYRRIGRIRNNVDLVIREQHRQAGRLDQLRDLLKGETPAKPAARAPEPPPTAAASTAEPVAARPPPAAPPVPVVPPPPKRVEAPARVPAPAVPPKPEAPRVPSAFQESVRDILGKIWNWILVGEEFRPRGVTTEYAVASTWLLRLGIVAIVMCAGYFLKWSMEKGLLGPAARVAISLAAGIGMLLGGMRLTGRKYHVIGQGLLGGGLLVFYFSMYAMGPMMYRLVEMPTTMALMVGVTVTAGILAVRVDSLLVAVIGIAGGFLTPVLLRTPTPHLAGFYAYLLMLNVGTLGIAVYKQWRLLNYLGFLFTYGLFAGSLDAYKGLPEFPMVMGFLSAFFVAQSAAVYLHNIVRSRACSLLEIVHLVANAAVFSAFGYGLIHNAYGRPYPALMSLALAVFYIAHVQAFLRRRYVDRNLLVALIALAGVFSTWTLPLVMEKESLTLALALLAFVFLWLGDRMSSHFLQGAAHLVYAAVFYRLLVLDMPRNFPWEAGAAVPMAVYWKAFTARLWTFGVSIGSLAAAFRLTLARKRDAPRGVVAPENDVPGVVPASVSGGFFYWMVIILGFLFLQLEFNAMFRYVEPFRLPFLTLLWCGMAAYFLWRWIAEEPPSRVAWWALCVFLAGALFKLMAVDLASWRFSERFVYEMGGYTALAAGMRLLDFGFVIAVLLLVWSWLIRRPGAGPGPAYFGYAALAVFFLFATLEVNSLLHWKLREFQRGGLSVLWALFAIAFIGAGIWRSIRTLRYLGLILFAIVAFKVFAVDLAAMPMIYRVVAFMVIGIALLLGSFAYIYSSRKFSREEPPSPGGA